MQPPRRSTASHVTMDKLLPCFNPVRNARITRSAGSIRYGGGSGLTTLSSPAAFVCYISRQMLHFPEDFG
jgi:hypothetical protein